MKHYKVVIGILAVMLTVFVGTATAEIFFAPEGSKVTGYVTGKTGTIQWTGMDIAEVHQYRYDDSDKRGFILAHKYTPTNNSVTVQVYTGDRFQLVNKQGKFLYLSPELAVANYSNLTLNGVVIECSNPKGCTLQFAR